ncbi:hypothetical protein BU23DRAFT_472649 [Bimuria novae-zelandiae CBS 107.79]|uniref:Protein kinase domain-containing protein n=1 Tax=Bimuria novae-zelandiae CBS 107.79 TaxID=1447943 RepID=A0A6A5V790_9PLEO|nr:hypothetical protein BU23DRAFT_472649 [Bimuria novae-zelandiae CBS 107.79]
MYLSPQTFEFQLATHEGRPIIVKREATSEPDKPRRLNSFDTSRLPSFHPSDVEVLGELKGNRILKVFVNGCLSCCKVVDRYTEKSVSRELALLQSLSASLPSIRVPKLVGIVTSDDEDLIAILLEYIQADRNTPTLNLVSVDSIERSRRQEWASQIRQTLNQLHELGIIWGDGKADNILIDEDDNAWIIDFGGSWTEGWVTPDLAGTLDGDLEALRKIVEFLKV